MKYYHKKRLLKLCDFLEQLPRKRFDFGVVAEKHPCGTIGCAIGWTPGALPRLVKWVSHKSYPTDIGIALAGKKKRQDYITVARSLFGLDYRNAHNLFTPGVYVDVGSVRLDSLSWGATPKQVAKRLREFLKLLEKDN